MDQMSRRTKRAKPVTTTQKTPLTYDEPPQPDEKGGMTEKKPIPEGVRRSSRLKQPNSLKQQTESTSHN